jgi:hypothetical protein
MLVGEAYGVSRAAADVDAALRLARGMVSGESLAEQVDAGYPLVSDPAVQARCPVEPVFEESLDWSRTTREYAFRDEMRLIEHEFKRAWRENAEIAATCQRVQAILSAWIESRAVRADHRELY